MSEFIWFLFMGEVAPVTWLVVVLLVLFAALNVHYYCVATKAREEAERAAFAEWMATDARIRAAREARGLTLAAGSLRAAESPRTVAAGLAVAGDSEAVSVRVR